MLEKEKTYILKTDNESQVVYIYKIRQGAKIDNRNWDAGGNFGRIKKAAKKLLEIVETVENAKQCINEIANKCDSLGVMWSLDGAILNQAPMWMVEKQKKDEIKEREERVKNCLKCGGIGYNKIKYEQEGIYEKCECENTNKDIKK